MHIRPGKLLFCSHASSILIYCSTSPYMSRFANNALLGVRVWIREQRKIKRRSKELLSLCWQSWTSLAQLFVTPCAVYLTVSRQLFKPSQIVFFFPKTDCSSQQNQLLYYSCPRLNDVVYNFPLQVSIM